MIARAIVHRPRLLIIDEGFNGIEDNVKLTIVKRLYDKSNPWTVVTISHDPEVVIESETVAVLHDGYIIEHGPVARVARHDGSMLQQLFPTLNSLIKQQ